VVVKLNGKALVQMSGQKWLVLFSYM